VEGEGFEYLQDVVGFSLVVKDTESNSPQQSVSGCVLSSFDRLPFFLDRSIDHVCVNVGMDRKEGLRNEQSSTLGLAREGGGCVQ